MRYLNYGIPFGKDERLCLICEREQIRERGIHESYLVEGNSQSVQFTPGELAELRAAIDEMLRMRGQHRDALTDGAGGRAADLTAGEADLVSEDDFSLLRKLAEGVTLLMGNAALGRFSKRGWVVYRDRSGALPPEKWQYEITDRGRRALDAQEPESESIVWAPVVIGTLENLDHGHLLTPGNTCFDLLLRNKLIEPADIGGDWYTISDAGRRALDAQETEAEDILSEGAMAVLQALDVGGAHIPATHRLFSELHGRGLIESYGDHYAISEKGCEAVLAELAEQDG